GSRGAKRLTSGPTARTTPAASQPRTAHCPGFGLERMRILVSSGLTETARTSTSRSRGPGSGSGSSTSRRQAGSSTGRGASSATAFMGFPFDSNVWRHEPRDGEQQLRPDAARIAGNWSGDLTLARRAAAQVEGLGVRIGIDPNVRVAQLDEPGAGAPEQGAAHAAPDPCRPDPEMRQLGQLFLQHQLAETGDLA